MEALLRSISVGLVGLLTVSSLAGWLLSRCGQGLHACWASVGDDIYKYQTLITGIMALVAALITLRPVQLQLRQMRAQSALMARDVLYSRAQETERRAKEVSDQLTALLAELHRFVDPDEGYGADKLHPEHAHSLEGRFGRFLEELRCATERQKEPSSVSAEIEKLIGSIDELTSCLNDLHAPASEDPRFWPELAELQQHGHRERLKAKALEAATQLPSRVHAVSCEGKCLADAFSARINALHRLVRKIDDQILEADFV